MNTEQERLHFAHLHLNVRPDKEQVRQDTEQVRTDNEQVRPDTR
jgi:hypothetical protein